MWGTKYPQQYEIRHSVGCREAECRRSSGWMVTNPRKLNSPFVYRRARSQVGPEFLHIALRCLLTKNILWNGECRHLALDFPNSCRVQCIFLLLKAEQVPLGEQTRLFVQENMETLNVRGMCSDNTCRLLPEIGCTQRTWEVRGEPHRGGLSWGLCDSNMHTLSLKQRISSV